MLMDDFEQAWRANRGSTPTHWKMTEAVWERLRAEVEATMTLVSDPKGAGKRELMGLPVILFDHLDGDWWLSNEPINDQQIETRLREQLADLHRRYDEEAKPIIDELVKLEAMKPPVPVLLVRGNELFKTWDVSTWPDAPGVKRPQA